MRSKLVNLNHCAVPYLSHATVNLCGHYTTLCNIKLISNDDIGYTLYSIQVNVKICNIISFTIALTRGN